MFLKEVFHALTNAAFIPPKSKSNILSFYQVVEGGALLITAHVFEKTIVGHKQQRAGVLTVVMRLPSLSQVRYGREAMERKRWRK